MIVWLSVMCNMSCVEIQSFDFLVRDSNLMPLPERLPKCRGKSVTSAVMLATKICWQSALSVERAPSTCEPFRFCFIAVFSSVTHGHHTGYCTAVD